MLLLKVKVPLALLSTIQLVHVVTIGQLVIGVPMVWVASSWYAWLVPGE